MAFVSEIEVALGLGCVCVFRSFAQHQDTCRVPDFFLYLLFSWAESFSLYAGSDRAIFVSVRCDEFTPLKCVANFSYTSESYSLSNCSNFGPCCGWSSCRSVRTWNDRKQNSTINQFVKQLRVSNQTHHLLCYAKNATSQQKKRNYDEINLFRGFVAFPSFKSFVVTLRDVLSSKHFFSCSSILCSCRLRFKEKKSGNKAKDLPLFCDPVSHGSVRPFRKTV